MKKLGISLVVAFALCLGLLGTALANGKDKKKTVTLDQDVVVSNQMLKRGTYELKFDASDSQVMILKDSDVVATVKVTVKEADKKSLYNSLAFTQTEKGKVLTSITFQGDKRVLHLNEMQNTSVGE
ncbi:MAG TPA: hypothetical protein PLK30_25550 [Blastocatellia bacterium]|nr:hypothetical protein [Blastocatellia bacterium]